MQGPTPAEWRQILADQAGTNAKALAEHAAGIACERLAGHRLDEWRVRSLVRQAVQDALSAVGYPGVPDADPQEVGQAFVCRACGFIGGMSYFTDVPGPRGDLVQCPGCRRTLRRSQ